MDTRVKDRGRLLISLSRSKSIYVLDLRRKHSSLSFYLSRTLRKRYEGTGFPKGEKSLLTGGNSGQILFNAPHMGRSNASTNVFINIG